MHLLFALHLSLFSSLLQFIAHLFTFSERRHTRVSISLNYNIRIFPCRNVFKNKIILGLLALATNAFATFASPIIIDGDISDWSENDYYASMHRAGNSSKQIESNLYLRFDCESGTMCALVLTVEGVPALEEANNAFIKFKEDITANGNGSKLVDGSSSGFAWVYIDGLLRGFEACFDNPGDGFINAHINVFNDGGSQTSAATTTTESNDRWIPLVTDCDNNSDDDDDNNNNEGPSTFSISGSVDLDPASCDTPAAIFDFTDVTVLLNGAPVAETDDNGNFTIPNVVPGTYTVTFVNPNESQFYVAPGSVIEHTIEITDSNIDLPLVQFNQYITITGLVSINVTGTGEIPFAGINVQLSGTNDYNEAVAVNDSTADDGIYLFEGLQLADANGYTLVYSYGGSALWTETLPSECVQVLDVAYEFDPSNVQDDLDNGILTGTGRTIGFWKAQLSGRKGKGNNLTAEMPALLGLVEQIALDDPYVFTPSPEGIVDASGVAEALAIIDDKNNKDASVKLAKQLLASELNSVTPGVGGLDDNLLEGALFNWGEYLLNNGSENEMLEAKTIFDTMNNMGH